MMRERSFAWVRSPLLVMIGMNGCGEHEDAGRWRAIATASAPSTRFDHTAVWTGAEMVVWGGGEDDDEPYSSGGGYDPGANRWRDTSPTFAPMARDDHVAVWTGAEMIVWGGNHRDERTDLLDSGGRYDPIADAWVSTGPSGLTARDDPRAVWTGSEMIVWGGRDLAGRTRTGARYNPQTDTWRPISVEGAPAAREDHGAVWTGTEMIVWGGWDGSENLRSYDIDGGRYDPAADTWRPVSTDGAPEPREDLTVVWAGTEMIVWGGTVHDGATLRKLGSGGRYDPATDSWTPISDDGAPDPREDHVVVWTGREMLVWGGERGGVATRSGGRYEPASDTWVAISADGAPSARYDHVAVWTGEEMIVWGGQNTDGTLQGEAAAYAP